MQPRNPACITTSSSMKDYWVNITIIVSLEKFEFSSFSLKLEWSGKFFCLLKDQILKWANSQKLKTMQISKLAWQVNFLLIFVAIWKYWQSFRPQICKLKVVVRRFIHKPLAKIYIHKHILRIFHINFINVLAKTIQRNFQQRDLKNNMSNLALDLAQILE